nr:MAG TPA: hypothetical protein [Caudoviricetes sp.]
MAETITRVNCWAGVTARACLMPRWLILWAAGVVHKKLT